MRGGGGVQKLHFDSQPPRPPDLMQAVCSALFDGGPALPENQIVCFELARCLLLASPLL